MNELVEGLPDNCLLCGDDRARQRVVSSHVYGDKSGCRAFYHCLGCDVRYQYPTLTPEEEARFYAEEFEKFMVGRAGSASGWQDAERHVSANEPTRLRRMKYLSPHLSPPTNVLEVGCSSGFMLYPLQAAGHACLGVEPSGVFSDYVRSRGVTVYPSLEKLIETNPWAQFDLIQHFFVLEHVANPLSFLRSQLALLKSNGKLIFEIPNSSDPLYSVYDIPAFERFYWSMAHPWYFSETSLRYLLNKLGESYEIILDQRYDLSNHLTWAMDGRPGGMGRFTEALGSEIEETYKQGLILRGVCDTLVAVITKQ